MVSVGKTCPTCTFTLFSDSFTDAGISKYNGEVPEKAMKELEPWIGDTEGEVGGLDSEKSVSILHLMFCHSYQD